MPVLQNLESYTIQRIGIHNKQLNFYSTKLLDWGEIQNLQTSNIHSRNVSKWAELFTG